LLFPASIAGSVPSEVVPVLFLLADDIAKQTASIGNAGKSAVDGHDATDFTHPGNGGTSHSRVVIIGRHAYMLMTMAHGKVKMRRTGRNIWIPSN